MDQKALTFADI